MKNETLNHSTAKSCNNTHQGDSCKDKGHWENEQKVLEHIWEAHVTAKHPCEVLDNGNCCVKQYDVP